jgi:hypothetical protein
MRFSKKHTNFKNWFASHDKRTAYVQRIFRLHNLYSSANLNQLRGHSAKGLTKLQAKPVYARAWSSLSPRERELREKALEVLSEARRTGRSLNRLARERGLTGDLVRKATNGFRKVNGRWRAGRRDHISRVMAINENGREVFVEIRSSRTATIISNYQSAIKEYLNTGNYGTLAKFKGKKIRDAQGKLHTLETDPDTIREIAERREEPEFYDIYGD